MVKTKKQASRSAVRWGTLTVFLLLAASLIFDFPGVYISFTNGVEQRTGVRLPRPQEARFHLGLDLQGGAHLVYEVDTTGLTEPEKEDGVAGVRDVIERRVNAFGVGEPLVQTNISGEAYRVIVELPGVVEVAEAIRQIGETPLLEFKEANPDPNPKLAPEQREQLTARNNQELDKANEVAVKARAGEQTFEELAGLYSEDAFTKDRGGEVGFIGAKTPVFSQMYQFILQRGVEGEVLGTALASDAGYHVVKVLEKKQRPAVVSARHILICFEGKERCAHTRSKEEALALGREVRAKAAPSNFATLAAEHSDDAGSAKNGGDLGEISAGFTVPEFEEVVFALGKGKISELTESAYGYHIIYKYDETLEQQVRIAHIRMHRTTARDIAPELDAWLNTQLSGKQLDRSSVQFDNQTGEVEVALQFDKEGDKLFEDITEKNVGKPVAIFLDGEIISAPVVQQKISGGQAIITGSFSIAEAKLLSQRLNAGALPLPVSLVSQATVGPALGKVSLEKSLKAGVIGFLLVLLFMVLYYRALGMLAALALLLYVALVLLVFKTMPVTLTLAGVAGFILSLGMAVDANVLIFERIREEMREGHTFPRALTLGFERAWPSIRDGNVSTLITCVILYWFGTSVVRGFAVTLSIGVLLSMFSAITITRILARFIEPRIHAHSRMVLGSRK